MGLLDGLLGGVVGAEVATVVNGQIPGPTLCWREGDMVTLPMTNRLKVQASINWHGIIL